MNQTSLEQVVLRYIGEFPQRDHQRLRDELRKLGLLLGEFQEDGRYPLSIGLYQHGDLLKTCGLLGFVVKG